MFTRRAYRHALELDHDFAVDTLLYSERLLTSPVARMFVRKLKRAGVPFAQVRAISNAVERRNRGAWKIDAAIRALGDHAERLLESA